MGDVVRILMLCAILAAATLPAAAFDGPTQTTGGKKSTKPSDKPAADKAAAADDKSSAVDEKGKAVAMAQQALDAGIKAYGAGKNDEALRAFDTALRGGLPSQQMARMLYYRGLTYRRGGKPGLAISDLTSAVWLKNGLSEAEKQDAIKARAVAYHEAGISDVPAVPQSAFPDAPAMPSTPSAPGWQTAMTESAAPDAATAPVSNAPAAPTPPSSGGGIGGFFSSITNMFSGSSSSAPKADESSVTTSSIDNSTPPPASAVEAASWTGTTQVAAAPPPAPVAQAPAPQAVSSFETKVAAAEPPSPPAARAPSGKFRLQVAAVRSRDEADVLAGRILQQHSAELGGRQPVVDEAVIGSMGTFYRVRLGPYANAKEPGQLCGALRADGFDCLVVTQ